MQGKSWAITLPFSGLTSKLTVTLHFCNTACRRISINSDEVVLGRAIGLANCLGFMGGCCNPSEYPNCYKQCQTSSPTESEPDSEFCTRTRTYRRYGAICRFIASALISQMMEISCSCPKMQCKKFVSCMQKCINDDEQSILPRVSCGLYNGRFVYTKGTVRGVITTPNGAVPTSTYPRGLHYVL